MPLAGHDHVVVAVDADLGGTAGANGDQGGGSGEQGRLALLAAEASTHAADFHRDGVIAHAQHLGDIVLHLGGMLGRGPDMDVAVLARRGERDLAFEIEMVLAADDQPPFQDMRRGGDGPGGVAQTHNLGGFDDATRGAGVRDGHQDGQVFVGDLRQLRRGQRLIPGLGGDGEQRLADVLDQAVSEERIVAGHGADVVGPGDVPGGDHIDDAGRGSDGGQVERDDAGVRPLAHAQDHMQQLARLGDVVDIERPAGDMTLGAVMTDGCVDHAISHGPAPHPGR